MSAAPAVSSAEGQVAPQATAPQKPSRLNFFGNWRFRVEAWDWFEPATGDNTYGFVHSLTRAGITQSRPRFDWLLEGAQDSVLGVPANAVAPGTQGALGGGATYFTANRNTRNNASAFVKQGYITAKFAHNARLTLGRFGFSDGTEIRLQDPTLAQLVNTRIAQRLIGELNFSAVTRSFDGLRLAADRSGSNLTLLAVRPTHGAYQIHAMGELNIDVLYGAYTLQTSNPSNAGVLRIFALGYLDERSGVVETDNRTLAARSATPNEIRIGTYGGDYVHVLHTKNRGTFNFQLWGGWQAGSWGSLRHRAGAFVGEFGWQPSVRVVNPWFSAGYSFGSGDSDPADNRHGTYFQNIPTSRLYARFPFYNMENNQDFYGTAVFRLPHAVVARSEWHALRLANARDLWYSGGGAFQPHAFGYNGRASGGARSLANVGDVSLDVPLRRGLSITMYYGHAWGKAVIEAIYPSGAHAQFGYLESNFRF